jgi:hypothetical protein
MSTQSIRLGDKRNRSSVVVAPVSDAGPLFI